MTPSCVVALVGRPNAGKSSLFNAVTSGHAKVGNFPGVTVELLEAQVKALSGEWIELVDLPGVYSIEGEADPESDEGHARRFLDRARDQKKPLVIAQVLDATQLELGLKLTLELRRRGVPVLVLATQHDALLKQGYELDAPALQEALGVDVLATSARTQGVKEQVSQLLADVWRQQRQPPHGSLDVRALAKKVLLPKENALQKFAQVRQRTERLDALLLHPVLGPVAFLGVMTALFAAVFLIAEPVTALIDLANQALGSRIEGALGAGWLSSLLVDGVLGGAGTVLAFLPQIVILTIAMELIDASGYLARGTYLVDRTLRFAGLGGRSFVPLLTAHACGACLTSRLALPVALSVALFLAVPLAAGR